MHQFSQASRNAGSDKKTFSMRFGLLCVTFLVGLYVSQGNLCINGVCQRCAPDELTEDYCSEYLRKMSVICGKKETWRGCENTPEDEQIQVLIFQATMALLGGLAYWGVRIKKSKNLTLFESRKKNGNGKSWYLAS